MLHLAKERLPLVLLALISLISAVFTGFARLGINTFEFFAQSAGLHGVLMISGFFGTVIGLERAVASRLTWSYIAPLASGLAGVSLLLGAPVPLSVIGFLIAGVCFTLTNASLLKKQPAVYTITLFTGSVLWLLGNAIWATTGSLWAAHACGLSFLVLTIAGERLELTRFLPPRRYATAYFIGIVFAIISATLVSSFGQDHTSFPIGVSYCALACWLATYDIAKKTVLQSGITRFVALSLLCGYAWLFIGGALLAGGWTANYYLRDASLHAIGLGFVFSMVIGHAPVIFPAVLRVSIPYSPLFYVPLLILQVGISIRMIGDLIVENYLRSAGGIINGIAIAALFLIIGAQAISSKSSNTRT